ncbi:hypothetical protein [Erythrobacter alti]|uniref:hypothetical protein n=1 Tax=Erythrobacter alti TaxID=1896145 RepID=UPI0030F4139F
MLIVPALFDEANKMRHFTVEIMRALDEAGIDTMLPDLPGTNESCEVLADQSLSSWQSAMVGAAAYFEATHVLALRGGALCAPSDLPCLRYAPVKGVRVLNALLRAQTLADREAGRESTREQLSEQGKSAGLTLAGYTLSPAMFRQLEEANLPGHSFCDIAQTDIGGGGLWLRAEPDHDPDQARALARIVAERLA